MLRLIASICLNLLANAVGLLIAALILPGFSIDTLAFITVVLLFTVVEVIAGPLIEKTASTSLPALSGGIALVTTLVGLLLTDYFSDGLTVSGLSTWVIAPLIIWLCSLLATVVLPLFLFKKILGNRSENTTH